MEASREERSRGGRLCAVSPQQGPYCAEGTKGKQEAQKKANLVSAFFTANLPRTILRGLRRFRNTAVQKDWPAKAPRNACPRSRGARTFRRSQRDNSCAFLRLDCHMVNPRRRFCRIAAHTHTRFLTTRMREGNRASGVTVAR